MKSVIFVRHAKSSWDDPSLDDEERPLNKRGKKSAPLMGKVLRSKNEFPEIIVTSQAKRAYDTALILAEEIGYPVEKIITDKVLYMPSPENVLKVMEKYLISHKKIMLVSHNPGITEFVNLLTGAGIDNIPTCGIVRVDFNETDFQKGLKGDLIYFEYPKKYKKSSG
ncbi:MAG: histidine phosphatase family protein [Ignavibacteria bacterium]|nr:histidine phosphatase family protein [Ignavibacteria bacterium]